MLGNVWESCEDHWHDSFDGVPTDGRAWLDTGASSTASLVFRGGSWGNNAREVRSRSGHEPHSTGTAILVFAASEVLTNSSNEQAKS